MVKYNIEITLSKIMAYVVIIIGSTYSFYYEDPNVLMSTFAAASAIIALKTWSSSKERIAKTENNEPEL